MLLIFTIYLLGFGMYGYLYADRAGRDVTLEKAAVLEKQGDFKKAMLEYKKVLKQYAGTEFGGTALYKIAILYNLQREEEKAKKKYKKFILSYPQHKNVVDAYLQLSYIEVDQKHYEKANNILREALRKYPDSKKADKLQYELFLNLYTEGKKHDETIKEAEIYLRNYPKAKYREIVQVMISSVYERKGDYAQALKELDKYLQGNPKDKKLIEVALSERSMIQSHIRREKFKQAGK